MIATKIFKMCIAIITSASLTLSQISTDELKNGTIVINGHRQDEVESIIINGISGIYTASSLSDIDNALSKLSEIATETEIEKLRDSIIYNDNVVNDIIGIQIYYCSGENSSDGMAREFVDLKVGKSDYNYMYIIEFIINNDGVIYKHKIYSY